MIWILNNFGPEFDERAKYDIIAPFIVSIDFNTHHLSFTNG